MSHIYLCGFQGVGKTTLGKKAAKILGKPFFDLDHELLKQYPASSIRDLFKKMGGEQFREKECEVLKILSKKESALISLGGGALEREESRGIVAATGRVLYLYKSYHSLYEKLREKPLPSFLNSLEDFEPFFEKRHAQFIEVAAEVVPASHSTTALERIYKYAQQ